RFTGAIVNRCMTAATITTVTTAIRSAVGNGRPLPTALIATSPARAANSPCARLITLLTVWIAAKPVATSAPIAPTDTAARRSWGKCVTLRRRLALEQLPRAVRDRGARERARGQPGGG